MVDYNKHIEQMTMTCDNCHEEETFDGSFQECIDQAKNNGWRITKDANGEWTHDCQYCAEEKEDL